MLICLKVRSVKPGQQKRATCLQYIGKTSWLAMLSVLLPTSQTCRQKIRLLQVAQSCGESREKFYFSRQNLYMLRVFPAHDKLVLQLFLRKSAFIFKMKSCWNHGTPYFLSLRYTEWWKVASCFWEPFRWKEGSAYEAAKVRLRMPQVLHNYSVCML